MLKAWKYSFNGHYLILAEKGNFDGVPPEIVREVAQATPIEWGDKPGEPFEGAVEHALQTKGFVYCPPL